ncbi:hypothetical protein TPA0598_08_05440 [Streptomyces lydicamycinicus]|uniref:Uncharacterized protein n=1 Tax=Streptomyces lydicamycinicus TaxID=1546107 RepID=A0A0P4REE5_9ACTN|nr:hypothetical protein TPA0598_08_05440 [Streptomyces lydicamycinicus]
MGRPFLGQQPLGVAACLGVQPYEVARQRQVHGGGGVAIQLWLFIAAYAPRAAAEHRATLSGSRSMAVMAEAHHRTIAGTRAPARSKPKAAASKRANKPMDGHRRRASVLR